MLKILFLLSALIVSPQVFSQEVEEGEFESVKQAPPVTENADSEWANGMAVGHPQYSGTGCPAGSASSTLSSDRKTLSLLFDNYIVEAGAPSQLKVNVKNCRIQIPFTVPPGY